MRTPLTDHMLVVPGESTTKYLKTVLLLMTIQFLRSKKLDVMILVFVVVERNTRSVT